MYLHTKTELLNKFIEVKGIQSRQGKEAAVKETDQY